MSSPQTITTLLLLLSLINVSSSATVNSTVSDLLRRPSHGDGEGSLCHQLILPTGYSCSEHIVTTKDGYLLALQRVSSPSLDHLHLRTFPPVLLLHGLFTAGDAWFLNPKDQSLGFLLADRGFDVWVANVRGTRWSHGHVSLSDRSKLLDSLCDGHLDCVDLLGSITGNSLGKNCCFNTSRVEYYLEYEPHPSSVKNLNHLFQMIRKGTFARYDYGMLKNKRVYGSLKPPTFDLGLVPESLPLWMGYGGTDDLADVVDVQRTIRELPCKKELLYLDNYGHVDFLLSVTAKDDVYEHMIDFFSSLGKSSSL
ncbi:hypothetical protein KSS87_011867 [Heliosperma pusillum]|nr:hypothetical protein KSS87_011867 [Heliosperma pusillum]